MRKFLFWATIIIIGGIYLGLLLFGASALALIPGQNQNPDLQARVEILRSITETVAVIIAGFWTYNRFIKTKEETREDYPYPTIQHRIEHYALENGLIYLSVFVAVTNEGKRKLDLHTGKTYIRQVSPLPSEILVRIKELIKEKKTEDIQNGHDSKIFIDSGQRLRLDTLGDRKWEQLRGIMFELEPSQTREIQFNFLIGSTVDVIEAISYFKYEESGWEHATLYSLKIQNTKATNSKKLKTISPRN